MIYFQNQFRRVNQVPTLKRVKSATALKRNKNGRRAVLTQSKIISAIQLRRGYPKSSATKRVRVPIKNRKSSAMNVLLNKSRKERNNVIYIPFRKNGIQRVIKAYIINNHRYIKQNIVIAKLANINSTLGSQNSGPINIDSNTGQKPSKTPPALLNPVQSDQSTAKSVAPMPLSNGLTVPGGFNGLTREPLANNAVLGIGNPLPQTNDHSLVTNMGPGTDFGPSVDTSTGLISGGGEVLTNSKPNTDSFASLTPTIGEMPLPKPSEMFFPPNVIGLEHGGKIQKQLSAHGGTLLVLPSGNSSRHHINRETVSSNVGPSGGAYVIIYVPNTPNRKTPFSQTSGPNNKNIFANSAPLVTENVAILPISPMNKRFSNPGTQTNTASLLGQKSNSKSVDPYSDLGLPSLLDFPAYPKSTGALEPSILPGTTNTAAITGKTPSEVWGAQNVADTQKSNQTPTEVWGTNTMTNTKPTASNFESATEGPPIMKENVKTSSTQSTESKSDLKNRILRALLENIM